QYPGLFKSQRAGTATCRRIHRQTRHHLQQVVLDHIADCAGLFVETSASFDAEIFGHRYLNASYVIAIPDRLEKGIAKTRVQNILNRFLTEKMIDTEYGCLLEDVAQNLIELFRRFQIASEWFFDDYASILCAAGSCQSFCDHFEHFGRNGQIMQ